MSTPKHQKQAAISSRSQVPPNATKNISGIAVEIEVNPPTTAFATLVSSFVAAANRQMKPVPRGESAATWNDEHLSWELTGPSAHAVRSQLGRFIGNVRQSLPKHTLLVDVWETVTHASGTTAATTAAASCAHEFARSSRT